MDVTDDEEDPDRETSGTPAKTGTPLPVPVKERMEAMRKWGGLASVGMSFAFAVVIGTFVGIWLDRVTGWSPFMLILFFFFGLAAGGLNVYRALKEFK